MNTAQWSRFMVLLTAGVLAFFSVASLIRIGEKPEIAAWVAFYSFMMLIESAALLFCYFRLPRRSKTIFGLTSTILALNIILPIFDQVGLADILFIVLNIAVLALLYSARKEFLPV